MKQEYTQTPTKNELTEMNNAIRELKEKAKESKIKARESFNTQLRAIEDQYDLIVAKINKTSHQASAATDEVKNGLSKAWINLKSSVEDASKYLH
tara:strand:+ start:2516 stop:2800 length:285 start_codon:yes stop_codon:yes gene_type:complete